MSDELAQAKARARRAWQRAGKALDIAIEYREKAAAADLAKQGADKAIALLHAGMESQAELMHGLKQKVRTLEDLLRRWVGMSDKGLYGDAEADEARLLLGLLPRPQEDA